MGDDDSSGLKFKTGKGQNMIFMGIFAAGIVILLLGMLLGNISGAIYRPDWDSDEFDGYETATRWLSFFSSLIISIGMVIIACGSIIIAMLNPKIPPALRAGMVVAGGLILGLRFG
jgi:hypothetical protein